MDYHEGRERNEQKRHKKVVRPSSTILDLINDLKAADMVISGKLDPYWAIIIYGVNVGFGDKE